MSAISATIHHAIQGTIPKPPLSNGSGIDIAIDMVLDMRALTEILATAVAARGYVGGNDLSPVFESLRQAAGLPASRGGGSPTDATPALLAEFGRAPLLPAKPTGPRLASTPLAGLTPAPKALSRTSTAPASLEGAFLGEATPARPRPRPHAR